MRGLDDMRQEQGGRPWFVAVVSVVLLVAAGAHAQLKMIETPGSVATPKKGDTFDPPLSAKIPPAVAALPLFGSIEWQTTQLPWVEEGPNAGISGVGMVALDGMVYVYGGFIPGGDESGDAASARTSRWMWRFDPAERAWEKLPDAPIRREYVRAIAARGHVYVIGGGCQYKKQEPPYRVHGECVALGLSSKPFAWQTLPPLNVPRTHTAVGCAEGCLVVAGGNEYDFAEAGYSHETIRDSVEILNLEHPEKGWQVRPAMPSPKRGWAASLATDHALYVFGGLTFNTSNEMVAVRESLCYTPTDDAWKKLAPSPLGISGWEGGLYAGRYALLVGGVVHDEVEPSRPLVWSDLAMAYDIDHDQWLRVEEVLPPGAVFNDPGVAVIGDHIYVVGAEGPGGSHFNYFMIGEIKAADES